MTPCDRRDEARTLIRLGEIYESSVDSDKALRQYHAALELYHTIGNPSGQANAYFSIAKAERARGDLSAADRNIRETLRIIESLRAGILGQDLRASYFSSVQRYYEFYTDLLMSFHQQATDKGFDRLALQTSEHSRARTLLELLIESRADIRQGVDASLLERERDLRQRLDEAATRQVKLKNQTHSNAEVKAVEKEISELTEDFKNIEARIRASSPHYAEITQPGSFSISEIQSILDENTVLLEYTLGESRSFLWLVTRDGLKSFVLPKRSDIELIARRVYESLTTGPNLLKQSGGGASVQSRQLESKYFTAAKDLSKILLAPVLPLIEGKRLLIVSDGALQYVPFAALPAGSTIAEPSNTTNVEETSSQYVPLFRDHEIVNLPSAETLVILRREAQTRPAAAKTLAVVADPVFSASDSRVAGSSGSRVKRAVEDKVGASGLMNSRVQRALRETGFNESAPTIQRLPFSRREANAIVQFVPSGQSLKLLDFKASRAAVTDQRLAQYRMIHIATHGLLNSKHPELSGLLFSLVDEHGQSQNGFLQLHEIYNLNLPVDLVVLSACQTALGSEIRGEGLIGLTRGFMYAGASRVVATLWKVDDEATAEMMRYFYEAMLKDKETPSAALRTAQRQMQRSNRFSAPYYWAGFTLQGEWR